MKLIKRVNADTRGPGQSDSEAEHMLNEELIKLQSNENGELNKNVEVLKVTELTKDSGITTFIILYDDKGMDIKKDA